VKPGSRRRRQLILGAVAAVIVALTWLRLGPLPAGLLSIRHPESIELLSRDGEPLYEARAGDGSRASWLDDDRLPPTLVDATIAAEDRRFWNHPGVDPVAILRATLRDVRRRRFAEGGSTITQQVAKLLLARSEATAGRRGLIAKLRETVTAVRLEHRLSKRQIIALYLNLAPYGNQLTGAQRAARAYFDRDATLLTPAQAAFLAALPQRPSSFNPYRDANKALPRQQRILVQMALLGRLTPDQVGAALRERLDVNRATPPFMAPHFVDRVLAAAGAAPPRQIVTTLDASLQRDVLGIIRAERAALDRIAAHNVAAVVLDNRTGEWLAWEGSGNYGDAEHGGAIDGVITPRQPGSALKPFTYAVAFDGTESPASVLPDIPSYYPTAQDGVVYAPHNYDNQFRGPLLARRALAGSENVPAVALASRVGIPNLLRFFRDAGFTTFEKTADHYGVGVTLGDAEVRLDQLVTAYAAFARGGQAVTPRFLRGSTQSVDGSRLMSERAAFWITDILSDDDARAYAFGRGGSLEFPFPVAAKTGTSTAYHDNWALGYTRSVTVGVWVGNFDRRPLTGSSGVSGAGPIFHAIMLAAAHRAGDDVLVAGAATSARPEGLSRQRICALSGMTASARCPNQIEEWLPAGGAGDVCTWHRSEQVVSWPSEYRAWAAAFGPRQPGAAALAASSATESLRVLNPPDGATYLIDPTLRREFQTLPLRAAAAQQATIEWQVDGRPVGRAAGDASVAWPLSAGRHVVSARDSDGRQADAAIVVK